MPAHRRIVRSLLHHVEDTGDGAATGSAAVATHATFHLRRINAMALEHQLLQVPVAHVKRHGIEATGVHDARAARRWEAAFHLLDAQRVAFSRYPWASNWFAAGIGPACVNLAEGMVSLGQLGAAEDLLREAEERIGGLRGTFPQKTWTRPELTPIGKMKDVAGRASINSNGVSVNPKS